MCNQAVSLVAAELERRGITTVTIQLLKEVAQRVRPPRALVVPFAHGFPLGRPKDPDGQREIVKAALQLTQQRQATPPLLVEYAK